ncbi:transposase [Patescibacteria group bacterium]|nr:transposase [Patescibacteria group bacterium]
MNIERDEHSKKINNPEIDKGNGYYERFLKLFSKNSLIVNIPRTRIGFSPNTLELLRINKEQMNQIVLSLYKKGMTGNDIKSFFNEVFDDNVSLARISDLSKTFNQFRKAWQKSKSESHYKVVFADVVSITVKRGNEYAKEGVFVAYGVREDNRRELLVLSINPTELAQDWGCLLRGLKQRGIQKINLFVADGLQGLEDEIMRIFPETYFQNCVIHRIRNIFNKTSPKDKKEVTDDLIKSF